MSRRTSNLASFVMVALSAFCAPSAQASYLVTFEEKSGDVVEVGSGALDLTDLLTDGHAINNPFIWPEQAGFDSGANQVNLDVYAGVVGPSNFGANALSRPDASTGDGVAIGGISSGFLGVPAGYKSGMPLSETSIYLKTTFALLGMTPGVYVYSWGAGAHADTFTISIGGPASPPAVPEPSTWTMLLLGLGGVGYIALRRKDASIFAKH
jgi:hypothetical protein